MRTKPEDLIWCPCDTSVVFVSDTTLTPSGNIPTCIERGSVPTVFDCKNSNDALCYVGNYVYDGACHDTAKSGINYNIDLKKFTDFILCHSFLRSATKNIFFLRVRLAKTGLKTGQKVGQNQTDQKTVWQVSLNTGQFSKSVQ